MFPRSLAAAASLGFASCVARPLVPAQETPERIESEPSPRPTSDCPPEDLGTSLKPGEVLRVTGSQTVVLGPGPYEFKKVCVQDAGVIRFCGSTVLRITGEELSVIGGGGIGPIGTRRGSLRLEAPRRPPLYVLVENKTAPVDLTIESPEGTVTLAITGKTGVNVSGSPLRSMTHNAGWGDTHNFPTCEGKIRSLCEIPPPPPPEAKLPPPPPPPEPLAERVRVFTASPEPHPFIVPLGVRRLTVEAWGAGGGGGSGNQAEARGGGGAFARATIPVVPGEELLIHVGGGGVAATFPNHGNTAGGGGGASYVTRGKTSLLVAAGGGGAGADGCGGCRPGSAGRGGAGGAEVGEPGENVCCYELDRDHATGGGGGTQATGGKGGVGPSGQGDVGAPHQGGLSRGWTGIAHGGDGALGGASTASNGAGGGGGAGLYGGGGGGFRQTYCGGGGGGGSSYSDPRNRDIILRPGAGPEPGNPLDQHWADQAGTGGAPGRPGRNGLVLLFF